MSKLRAFLRILASIAVLALLVGGVPGALLQFGDWPITGVPTGEQLSDAPNALLTDSAILGVITVTLWAAWALLMLALGAEVVAQARGVTRPRISLGGPFERLAGFLVGSIVLSFASASAAGAAPALPAPSVGELPQPEPGAHSSIDPGALGTAPEVNRIAPDFASAVSASLAADGPVTSADVDDAVITAEVVPVGEEGSTEDAVANTAGVHSQPSVTVNRGDTPWSIAEARLGDGSRWREIWELNRVTTQPDGGQWASADGDILPGWDLLLPDDAAGTDAAEPIALGPADGSSEVQSGTEVTVEPGDHFWGLAKKGLASWGHEPSDAEIAAYWQDMMEENEDRLLPPGDPDLIYPGQVLAVPALPGQPVGPHSEGEAAPESGGDAEAPPSDAEEPTGEAEAEPEAPSSDAETPSSADETEGPSSDAEAPVAEDSAPGADADNEGTGEAEDNGAADEEADTSDEAGDDEVASDDEAPTAAEEPAPPVVEIDPEETVDDSHESTPPSADDGPESDAEADEPTEADTSDEDEAPVAESDGSGTNGSGTNGSGANGEADSLPGDSAPGPSIDEETAAADTPDQSEDDEADTELPPTPPTGAGQDAAGSDVDVSETSSNFAVEEDTSSSTRPIGLIAGGLAVAGAVALLLRRRRAQLRRRRRGEYVPPPGDELQTVEQHLLEGADQDGAVLLDAALRAAAAGSGPRGLPRLRWVETGADSVTLVLEGAAPPPAGFDEVDAFIWQTRASAQELGTIGASAAAPAPTLVPVGATTETTEALIELEASGVLTIDGPVDDVLGLVRAMALAAATAPWSEQSRVLLVGMGGDLTDLPWVGQVTLDEAIAEAETHAERTARALESLQCRTTTEARASGLRPEAWDPLVVICAERPDQPEQVQRLTELSRMQCNAVGFVTLSPSRAPLPGRAMVIQDDGAVQIDRVDQVVWPRHLDEQETNGLVALMAHAGRRDEGVYAPLPDDPGVRRPARPSDLVRAAQAEASGATGPDEERPQFAEGPAPEQSQAPESSLLSEPEIPSLPDLPDLPDLLEVDDLLQEADEHVIPKGSHDDLALKGAYDDGRYGAGADSEPDLEPLAEAPAASHGEIEVARSSGEPGALRLVGGLDELLDEVEVLVRVLGDVEAVRVTGGSEEKLVPTRQKGLEAITYLALRETSVGREDLEINLFPDGAQKAKTVYNTISSARALVGEDLFPAPDGSRYVLSDRVVTDYGLFCELVAQADEIEDAGQAARFLTDALSVVRGEPFLGVGRNYTWVGPHRGMIVAQVVDAAEELAEIRLATDDWRAAEWAARQGLKAFPADERMYRLLMRAAAAAGNVAGVRRVFSELCDVTADPDLGVEPEDTLHPETVELLEELTRSTPSNQVSA